MTVTTTLLSSTSLANEASTPLDPAKIQRPDSTASVILEGNNKKIKDLHDVRLDKNEIQEGKCFVKSAVSLAEYETMYFSVQNTGLMSAAEWTLSNHTEQTCHQGAAG